MKGADILGAVSLKKFSIPNSLNLPLTNSKEKTLSSKGSSKVTLAIIWLEQCQLFGFKDKSELVRTAINRLYEQLKQQQKLRESAQLYAEIYETDEETRALTEAALA